MIPVILAVVQHDHEITKAKPFNHPEWAVIWLFDNLNLKDCDNYNFEDYNNITKEEKIKYYKQFLSNPIDDWGLSGTILFYDFSTETYNPIYDAVELERLLK